MPPPNVTGQLHMGHTLDNTLQDILIRFKRMEGYNVAWIPGTDHAGIATQVKVEQQLAKEEGKSRYDIGREEFLKRVWAWKEQYGSRIEKQVRRSVLPATGAASASPWTTPVPAPSAKSSSRFTKGPHLSGPAHYQLVPALPYGPVGHRS